MRATRSRRRLQWVGDSAPGGPASVERPSLKSFFNHLPSPDPPPIGLEKRSTAASASSPSASSSFSGGSSRRRGTCCWRTSSRSLAGGTLRCLARMAPKTTGGSSTTSRLAAMAKESTGELLRPAIARSMSPPTEVGRMRLLRGERAMPFDRQVATRKARSPCERSRDLRVVEAPRAQQRRLHRDRGELIGRTDLHIDEHGDTVGPSQAAGFGGGDLDRSSRDGRCQKVESLRSVAEQRGRSRAIHGGPGRPRERPEAPCHGRADGPMGRRRHG